MARVPFLLKEGLEVEGGASIEGGIDVRGSAIFNEDSADVDFRIESNGDANMFFVDGSTNRIGIGTDAPKHSMEIVGTSTTGLGTPQLSVTGRSGASHYTTIGLGGGQSGGVTKTPTEIGYLETSSGGETKGKLIFATRDATSDTAPSVRMTIATDGKVGIGTTAPASLLHVGGTMQVGSDGTNYDVNFFGDTSGRDLSWNAGEDSLKMKDNVKIKMGTGDDIHIYHDGTNSYFTNGTGAMNIATETTGIGVSIGNSTSVVTIGDNLTVTDTLTELSMREMKTNIEPIENILPSVLQMQGVSFDWKKDEDKGLTNYGFIAEDVDKILPNLVSHDEEGKAQGIQYSKMTAVLLEAIKEQQIQIDELKSKIN